MAAEITLVAIEAKAFNDVEPTLLAMAFVLAQFLSSRISAKNLWPSGERSLIKKSPPRQKVTPSNKPASSASEYDMQ